MEIIINQDGEKLNLSKDFYKKLSEEKDRFIQWLDGFENFSFGLEMDECDSLYHLTNTFEFNEELDDIICGKIEKMDELDEDYTIPSFDFSIINGDGGESFLEDCTFSFILILLNFPDVIEKIKTIGSNLGDFTLSAFEDIGGKNKMEFLIFCDFDDSESMSKSNDKMIEKICEFKNKLMEEY